MRPVLERVAEGGMGVVFAAYDGELHRKITVKLPRRAATDESMRKRIDGEAQAMAKLSHPNVAQVSEVGVWFRDRARTWSGITDVWHRTRASAPTW